MNKFAYFLLMVILLAMLGMLMTGCSAGWHLKQSKRHELIAISKGANIDTDTIYKTVTIEVPVPGGEKVEVFVPVIDSLAFDSVMSKNDSLVVAIYKLRHDISSGMALDKEKAMSSLKRANEELKALRGRVAQGFSQDSTYRVQADSLTEISIEIENGLLKKATYIRKPTKLTFEEKVPVEVKRIFSYGYTYWQVLGSGLLLLVVGFTIGYFVKSR